MSDGPDIGFAPGAQDNELAVWAVSRIRSSVSASDAHERDFYALRAAVCLVAFDDRLQVTLRFDHGYLTVHDGMVGVPDLTICGDRHVLEGIAQIELLQRTPLPALSRAAATAWRRSALELFTGELKVYGLATHPRLTLRLLRLLSGGTSDAQPS